MKLATGGSISQGKGGVWQFTIGVGAERFRKSTGTKDVEEAMKIAAGFVNCDLLRRVRIPVYSSATTVSYQHYSDIYKSTRKNAKKRGIEFCLSRDDMQTLVRRARDACEVTGIVFHRLEGAAKYERHPFAPSIDRIDSNKTYTMGNCRLVCVSVNFAINTWGEWVLHEISAAMRKTRVAKPRSLKLKRVVAKTNDNILPTRYAKSL